MDITTFAAAKAYTEEYVKDTIDSSGGLTKVSWKDVKDKPFEEVSAGQIITWDGNVNGLQAIEKEVNIGDDQIVSFNLYKVSDTIITKEQVYGSNFGLYMSDGEMEMTANFIEDSGNGIFYITSTDIQAPLIFVCSQAGNTMDVNIDGIELSFTLPKTGVWFAGQIYEGQMVMRVTSFEIPAEIKTLDIKFLPKNMALGYEEKGEGIIWDGNTDGLTKVVKELEVDNVLMRMTGYKMSDETPSIDEIVGKECFVIESDEETSYTITEDSCIVFADNGSYLVGEGLDIIVCLDDNTVLPLTELMGIGGDIVCPEAGIWFTQIAADGVVTAQTTSLRLPDTLVPINEKFIPDTIVRKIDLDEVISSLDSALASAIGMGVLS